MSFGAAIYNNENKIILSTDRHTYQFMGKYTPDYLSLGNFGLGNTTSTSTTPACLGATLALPTGITNNFTDWIVFFRYVSQDVEFGCGPVVPPVIQQAGSATVTYTGLLKNDAAGTSNVHTFTCPISWAAAADLSSFKVGDTVAVAFKVATNLRTDPGYIQFQEPTAYAVITSITSNYYSGGTTIGVPRYTITFDRAIYVNYTQHLLNVTAAQTNRSNVTAYINHGTNINNSNCEFYVFCRMNNNAVVSNSQYGIRLYDSTGDCTFDSNRRALNIAARSNSPDFSTLSPALAGGWKYPSGIYTSSVLPNYSVDVGTIPTNWAIGSSGYLGYYYNTPGSQSNRANYTYTTTYSTSYCLQTLMPTVDISDKTKLAIRPTAAITYGYSLDLASRSGYFLNSINNNQLTLLIDTDKYQ